MRRLVLESGCLPFGMHAVRSFTAELCLSSRPLVVCMAPQFSIFGTSALREHVRQRHDLSILSIFHCNVISCWHRGSDIALSTQLTNMSKGAWSYMHRMRYEYYERRSLRWCDVREPDWSIDPPCQR